MKKIIIVLLLGFVCLQAQEPLDVWVLAGEGNATGAMGDAAYMPPDPIDQKIPIWWSAAGISYSDCWVRLRSQPGLFPVGHFGPEISFIRMLKRSGANVAIFKFTAPNTSLFADWKRPGTGGLYDQMKSELLSAIQQAQTVFNRDARLAGFMWLHGESDAGNIVMEMEYAWRFMQLIDDMRLTFGPDFRIVLGIDEQHPDVRPGCFILQLFQALEMFDSRCAWVSMIGLEKADQSHLTPAGLIAHGERIFWETRE